MYDQVLFMDLIKFFSLYSIKALMSYSYKILFKTHDYNDCCQKWSKTSKVNLFYIDQLMKKFKRVRLRPFWQQALSEIKTINKFKMIWSLNDFKSIVEWKDCILFWDQACLKLRRIPTHFSLKIILCIFFIVNDFNLTVRWIVYNSFNK